MVTDEVPLVLPSQDKGKGKAVDANSGEVVQASKPAQTATSTPVQPPPRIPRRTLGLKGKKAPISLTSTAVDRLKSLLADPTNPQLIRISVKNRGCAGMAYHLEYVTPPGGKFDEVVEQDGIKVLIDSKALFSIIGSEMDWKEDRLSAKFVFNNPNVKDSCGCGESFTI